MVDYSITCLCHLYCSKAKLKIIITYLCKISLRSAFSWQSSILLSWGNKNSFSFPIQLSYRKMLNKCTIWIEVRHSDARSKIRKINWSTPFIKDFTVHCIFLQTVSNEWFEIILHKKGIFKGHLGHEAKISLRVCFTFCECDIAYIFSLKKKGIM